MDRIDALRLFLDVAEMGSFSKVARQRSVATSTVTLAVGQLEQEFGARLMARSTRRLNLTHEGVSLLGDARRIVSEWDLAIAGLRDDGPLSGPIRIAATNDFGRMQLRSMLDEFQERHPQVRIVLLLNDSNVDLLEDHVDLALRSAPLPNSAMRARLLMRGKRLVCASPTYWARAGRPCHPNDLADHNCIILARPGAPLSTWPFVADGKPLNVKPAGDRQASDGDVLRQWAVEGRGVVFKNQWDIRKDLDSGALETVLEDYAAGQVDLYAVQPSGSNARRVAALVDHIARSLAASSV